ncbi:hypothetical protein EVAR_88850_1 [Eumeta japonica]|uniref:Uncharacterized protein n=1 Tax=Eumeta variegata TaxID=151549 RepID=A0A4C1Y8D8_EUMVA|nr:hypothetical protein EVAR_88850_1 [Eumeta japonica]
MKKQTLLTQWKMDDYIELFKEKPESNQSGVAVENAKEFSDVSDFILNINNELEDLPLGNYKIATTTEKRVQKVWSNKQKVIIIVNSSALTYYLESVSSDNALFEFEDSSDLLQWLENCTDPWDTVESHWIRTAGTRLKLVKNTNAPASVYINKYPALKKPTGYILKSSIAVCARAEGGRRAIRSARYRMDARIFIWLGKSAVSRKGSEGSPPEPII